MIAISRTDGAVSIMTLAAGADAAAEIKKWQGVHPGEYLSHNEIAPGDLPASRIFRRAWLSNGKAVGVDMARARTIHMGRIRVARDATLAALDVETIRAVGKGDTAARDDVEKRKQVLRDVPATFDLAGAKTPEDLAALWPADLARP